jgi:hypothetical protein
MNRCFFIALMVGLSFGVAAQSNFLKIYSSPGYQSGDDMIEDEDHNYVIVGGGQSSSSGSLGIFAAKVDANGQLLWTRYIEDGLYAYGAEIFESPNGYVVLGNVVPRGPFLGLLDKDGNKLSSVIMDDSLWTAITMAKSGGDLIVAGEKTQKNNIHYNDIILVKTDIHGNTTWVKKFGTIAENERPFKILAVKEGGCMLVGITTENAEWPFYENALVLRIDEDGNIIWKKVLGGNEQNVPYDLIRTADGNFVFITHSNGHSGVLNVTKIDLNGMIIWDKPINGEHYGGPRSVAELPDGSLVVTGQKVTYFNIPPEPPRWVLFWKLSGSGDLVSQRVFEIGQSPNDGFVVMNTHDSSLILTGRCRNGTNTDLYLLKIGADLCMMPTPDLGQDVVSCNGPVKLDAGPDMPNYYWNTGASTQTINVTESGDYVIEVKQGECTRSDMVTVEIKVCGIFSNCIESPEEDFDITIPNVVTANEDELNSRFVIPDIIAGSKLVVYNRWGSIVYSNDQYDNSWDGTDLSSGVYFYVLTNACLASDLKGTVSIVR